jgi:S-formylglutathione hydrolase FrmB
MWSKCEMMGKPVELFTPSASPLGTLLFLTDRDGVSPQNQETWSGLFEQHRLQVIVVDSADGWWVDRHVPEFHPTLTPERYLLEAIAPWAKELGKTEQLGLVGIGAGGQGALRLGFRHSKLFRAVAGLSSVLDFHELYGQGTSLDTIYRSREHCRQDTAILQIHAHQWPALIYFACDPDSHWLRGNDRLREKLSAVGVPHETEFAACVCGHSWSYYNHLAPRAIRLVAETLQREARRLI